MAGRNHQARRTQRRKAEQAERRYVEALRREVTRYESYGNPDRMSKERMEEIVKRGKLRHGLTGVGYGIPLAMAAAAFLELSPSRRTR